jgi:hypothetical protein
MGKKPMGMKGALKKYEDSPADRKQHAAGVKEGSKKDLAQDKAAAKKMTKGKK